VPDTGSEGRSPNGIQVLSPTDIWFAGATEQTDGGQLALTERFNRTNWSISPAADPGQGVLRTLALTTSKG
jgi:hypothetical protein